MEDDTKCNKEKKKLKDENKIAYDKNVATLETECKEKTKKKIEELDTKCKGEKDDLTKEDNKKCVKSVGKNEEALKTELESKHEKAMIK